jgi:hypothetical protein
MPAQVKGAIALRKALKQFEPDLAKSTQREIASALKPIVTKARGFLPSNDAVPSGWLKIEGAQGKWATRYYDQSEAKRGITYKTTPSKPNSRGFRAVASILNKSAGGSIYETAGRKTTGQQGNSTNPNAGQEFIAGLGGTANIVNADNVKRAGRHSNKQKGRAMFRAVAEDEGKAKAAVMKALESAERKFKGRT